MKRVVVTGIGAITPIGNNFESYRKALLEGKSGANLISRFDASEFKTQIAAELKDYDAENFFHRRDIRRLDRFSQYALIVAEEAMNDSGIDTEKLDLSRAGVIWGSGIGGFETIEHDIEEATLSEGPPRYSPFLIPMLIADIAPGHISMKYGFRGVNYATVSACASSSHAISAAFDYVRLGRGDVMITGGSEAAITKAGIGGFSSMKALSQRNDDPATASRPFDVDRDGFLLGEGGGCLILEEYEHAKARGAKIYAEVIGSGATADAHHMTAPHPEGLGAKEVMNMAIKDAGIEHSDVDYINVHGTSTPLGDIAETKAILQVFGEHSYNLNISSTKSMTGHLLGAAGAVEAIACIVAINESKVPPTINHFTDDPKLDPRINFTFNKAQEREVNVALSNTFGFGGHNSTVIFKKI
ncbi:MAG: beta-ketoacyl-ACP synthase II [Saprospiraceae bacterium]|jgi:3-oxoacyl-[acyl-carrier-protein] synthase II|nr:beta-ketoacyl-[acyl-carrier-protein] synthase II [Chitinophagia bacterium]